MVLLVSTLALGGISQAHLSNSLTQCGLFSPLKPHGSLDLVDAKLLQNGLLAELYDINGDGQPDIAMFSPTYGVVEKTQDDIEVIHGVGILYEIDFPPQDGRPDVIYIDIPGEQTCESLTLYYDLSNNRDPNSVPKGAMIRRGSLC
jgi:hypothetical protein